jgi:hypothetical protein
MAREKEGIGQRRSGEVVYLLKVERFERCIF